MNSECCVLARTKASTYGTMGEIENANTWHMWGKQERKHPLDWAPSPSYSTLILAKWSLAKCSLSSWPSINLSNFQCKDERDLFSRCFEYPAHACHVTCVMLAELLPDVGAKAESNMAWSFEDSRSSAGTWDLAALLHRSWYPERWRLGGVANNCKNRKSKASSRFRSIIWRFLCGTNDIAMLIAEPD